MAKQEVTVNLTIPMLIWIVEFSILALTTGWAGFWVIAALPVLFWLMFILFAFTVVTVAFLRGCPVKVTTPRKGTRTIRRR